MHSFCLNCKEYSVLEDGYCQVCEHQYNIGKVMISDRPIKVEYPKEVEIINRLKERIEELESKVNPDLRKIDVRELQKILEKIRDGNKK